MRFTLRLAAAITLLPLVCLATDDPKATALADEVIAASGGAAFQKLRALEFTFNVTQGEKMIATAEHVWDIAANRDTVKWNGKTVTVDLTAANDSGDEKAAFQRWVNDSYWLLAPLKLRDPGTTLSHLGKREAEGKTFDVLQIAFRQVGLTPGDKYNFYIDPETKLVARWDYMPSPEKTTSGTWEKYEDFAGVKIATEHQFGDKRIYFTNVKATPAE